MRWLSWLILLSLLILAFTRIQRGGPKQDIPAPSIVSQLVTGEEFVLESVKGKIVLLDFWATWCPPCRVSLPALEVVARAYKDDPNVWIGSVNQENISPEILKRFLQKQGLSFPVILDPQGTISSDYRIRALPTLVVIDSTGVVTYSQVGLSTKNRPDLINHLKGLIEVEKKRMKALNQLEES